MAGWGIHTVPMAHLTLEPGPAGDKKRALGTALLVTVWKTIPPKLKHTATSTVLAWEPQGLLQREKDSLPPKAGHQRECGGSGGHFQSQMGKFPRLQPIPIQSDHSNPQDPCCPFPKGCPFTSLFLPAGRQTQACQRSRGEAGVGVPGWGCDFFFLLLLAFSDFSSLAAEASAHLLPTLPPSACSSRGLPAAEVALLKDLLQPSPLPTSPSSTSSHPGGDAFIQAFLSGWQQLAQLWAGRRASSPAHVPGTPSFAVTPLQLPSPGTARPCRASLYSVLCGCVCVLDVVLSSCHACVRGSMDREGCGRWAEACRGPFTADWMPFSLGFRSQKGSWHLP